MEEERKLYKSKMCVSLGKNLRLLADDDNWIIEEAIGKNKKGEDHWVLFGYYSKLGIALNDFFTIRLRREPAKDISELIQAAERISKELILAVQPIDSWGVKSESAQKTF